VVQKEAEDAVEDFRDEGFEVEEADTLLQEAEEAIHEGRYVLAEEYSGEVKAWIEETRIASRDAMAALEAAAASISTAEYDGRTSSLDQARETLQAAHNLYDEGGFLEAISRAEQASIIAQLSTTASLVHGHPHRSTVRFRGDSPVDRRLSTEEEEECTHCSPGRALGSKHRYQHDPR
jgi:hypothetical protein